MPRKNNGKPCLLTQNKYLRDPAFRKAMTERSVRNSCLIEGIHPPKSRRNANSKS